MCSAACKPGRSNVLPDIPSSATISTNFMPFDLQYDRSLSRCASRLTPSLACSCVLTRTYPMAVLVRSACGVGLCMQTVVKDFADLEVGWYHLESAGQL